MVTTSDGVQLHVKVEGTGPACLYIHGGPGSGSHWLEVFLGDELERHFQMVYLDQRGVGRSSSPMDNNYSMARMVMDFEEVRASLQIDQWLLLGHSFGGILQMGYVSSYPDAVSGMIFINGTLDMNDSFGNSWLPKAMELAGDAVPEICRDTNVSVYRRIQAIMPILGQQDRLWEIFFADREHSQTLGATYASFAHWNSDQSEAILEFDEYWRDYRDLSRQVEHPVLFYYGERDWAIGPEHHQGIHFPKMLLWSSKAGHMPFLECRDDLVHAIRTYVEIFPFKTPD